jgi:hypothetical protein
MNALTVIAATCVKKTVKELHDSASNRLAAGSFRMVNIHSACSGGLISGRLKIKK